MNFNDGASNLTKLITEFGLINVIFVIIFVRKLDLDRQYFFVKVK